MSLPNRSNGDLWRISLTEDTVSNKQRTTLDLLDTVMEKIEHQSVKSGFRRSCADQSFIHQIETVIWVCVAFVPPVVFGMRNGNERSVCLLLMLLWKQLNYRKSMQVALNLLHRFISKCGYNLCSVDTRHFCRFLVKLQIMTIERRLSQVQLYGLSVFLASTEYHLRVDIMLICDIRE